MPVPLVVAGVAGAAALYKYYSPPTISIDDRTDEEKKGSVSPSLVLLLSLL
jgi:hypothetical protein